MPTIKRFFSGNRPRFMQIFKAARRVTSNIADGPRGQPRWIMPLQIKSWLEHTNRVAFSGAKLQRDERALNCATCHQTKDRHLGLFGTDCAQCHTTDKWTITEFRHPSTASQSCAQCHQAPPSHYMGHFHMVSMRVAGQEHANVQQCFLCHQTTSWNDIRGVGYYKHH